MLLPLNSAASPNINRLAGQDRFQTARTIAEQYNSGTVQDVIIASGNNFPDALAVSVLARKLNAPLLLVDSKLQGSSEAFDYIKQHLDKSGKVHIIGGTGIIGTDFEIKLSEMGYQNIERIGGSDRYETGYLLAKKLAAAKNTPVVISSGENFPDALSISSIAGSKGWPILLVGKNKISQGIKDYLLNGQPSQVYILGGPEIISDDIKNQIQSFVPNTLITRLAGQDRFETNSLINKTFAPNPQNIYFATGLGFADALVGSVVAAQTGAPIILIEPSTSTLPKTTANYLAKLHAANLNPNLIALGGLSAVPDEVLRSSQDIVSGTAKENSIYSIEDITAAVCQYQSYSLPATVPAKLYNSDIIDVPVKWDPSSVDTGKIGSSTYEGVVAGYSKKVKLTLIVNLDDYNLGKIHNMYPESKLELYNQSLVWKSNNKNDYLRITNEYESLGLFQYRVEIGHEYSEVIASSTYDTLEKMLGVFIGSNAKDLRTAVEKIGYSQPEKELYYNWTICCYGSGEKNKYIILEPIK